MGMSPSSQKEYTINPAPSDRLGTPEMTENLEKPSSESTKNKNITKEKSPSPPVTETKPEPINTPGENIFLQIDPTAKRKPPAVTPPVLRKKAETESTGR